MKKQSCIELLGLINEKKGEIYAERISEDLEYAEVLTEIEKELWDLLED